MMITRIILADDHQIVRAGLRALLTADPHLEVVGEAGDGLAALALAEKLDADVVVIDISMPGLNGIEATQKIRTRAPRTKIVALSMHADRHHVADMLRAGASGYLLKDSAGEELTLAIRTVMAGKTYLSPGIAALVADGFARGGVQEQTVRSILTEREREVLQRLAEGKSLKEIAFDLGVSVKTIETHRAKISEKLGISSIAELTKYAIREGLTSLD